MNIWHSLKRKWKHLSYWFYNKEKEEVKNSIQVEEATVLGNTKQYRWQYNSCPVSVGQCKVPLLKNELIGKTEQWDMLLSLCSPPISVTDIFSNSGQIAHPSCLSLFFFFLFPFFFFLFYFFFVKWLVLCLLSWDSEIYIHVQWL